MKCALTDTLLLCLALIPQSYVLSYVHASSDGAYWSQMNVVSIYQPITYIDHDYDALVRVLAETATDLVWHAYYVIPGAANPDHGDPGLIAPIISYVKARLPWVRFQGAVDAYDYCPSGPPDPNVVANTGNYPQGYQSCYEISLAKPAGVQIVVKDAEQLVDAGVDMIHFDCIICGRGAPNIEAWHQIVTAVKDYAKTYNRDVLVTTNNGLLDPESPIIPYQDYLDLGMWGTEAADMIRSGSFQIPWTAIKSEIMGVYGHMLPMIAFIDSGGPGDPMPTFARLPVDEQIAELKTLHESAINAGAHFAYPLHGLTEVPYAENSKGAGPVMYDAIVHGTYSTIVKLANSDSKIAARNDWLTIKQALMNLTSAQDANLVSDRAISLLANATLTYSQMAQAFMINDTQTVTRLTPVVLQLIASAYNAEAEYHTAETALMNAANAIQTAQVENRTVGLDTAKQLFNLGFQALQAGNFTGAIQLANQARMATETTLTQSASQATVAHVPETAMMTVVLTIVTLLVLVGMILRRKRRGSP